MTILTLNLLDGRQVKSSDRPQVRKEGFEPKLVGLIDRFERWLNQQNNDELRLAYNIASAVHEKKKRKSPKELPYIYHPVGVALWVKDKARIEEPEIIIAALLHDTYEDHPDLINLDLIGKTFGPRVRKIVEKLTNPDIPEMASDHEWNQAYAHHVADAIKDDDALVVKLADYFKNAPKLKYTAREGKAGASARSAAKYLLLVPEFQARIPESKYSRNLGWAVEELNGVKSLLEQIIAADSKAA